MRGKLIQYFREKSTEDLSLTLQKFLPVSRKCVHNICSMMKNNENDLLRNFISISTLLTQHVHLTGLCLLLSGRISGRKEERKGDNTNLGYANITVQFTQSSAKFKSTSTGYQVPGYQPAILNIRYSTKVAVSKATCNTLTSSRLPESVCMDSIQNNTTVRSVPVDAGIQTSNDMKSPWMARR